MIPQPSRNQTPSVYGLSELPDGSFLSSNATLRKDIYKSHLISVQRLHDLLLRLTLDRQNQPLSFTRPTIAEFFPNITKLDQQDALISTNAIISAIAFVLGRLAFQKNLILRADELFNLAKEKMAEEQVWISYFIFPIHAFRYFYVFESFFSLSWSILKRSELHQN